MLGCLCIGLFPLQPVVSGNVAQAGFPCLEDLALLVQPIAAPRIVFLDTRNEVDLEYFPCVRRDVLAYLKPDSPPMYWPSIRMAPELHLRPALANRLSDLGQQLQKGS